MRTNVVLVVLDTVRADAVNQRITPNVHDLSMDATVFDNAWSVAPWTVPSHASIFTGMLPSVHGCTSKSPFLKPELETLAGLLNAAGYETAAFFSNPWLGAGGARLLRGFETKRETPLPRFFSAQARYLDGDQGGRGSIGKVRAWLDQREADRPFFLFVNLLEAHLPYDPPDDIRQRLSGLDVEPE